MSAATPTPDGTADIITRAVADLRDVAATQRDTAAALAAGLDTLTALTTSVTALLREAAELGRAQRVLLDPPAVLAARLTANGKDPA